MSHGATIARVKPSRRIAKEEWVQFAQRHPRLTLESASSPAATALHVDGPKNLRIFWSEGQICCGAPTPQIIDIMFECARELKSVIIGPKGHIYTSIEDWQARTRDSRELMAALKTSSKVAMRRRRLMLLAKLLIGVLISFLIFWLRKA